MPFVEVESYSKVMHRRTVLSDVTCFFEKGSVSALRGRNGSGKTMLLRAVAGLIRPTAGCVRVGGGVVGKDFEFPPSLGLMIEAPQFIGSLTGLRNLELLASIRSCVGPEQVRDAISRCGLDADDRRPFSRYSLGMKQRLGIACAVMEQPDIVLLDEPFNALDADGVELVKGIIAEESNRGAVVIVATHDKSELEGVQDHVMQMEDGRVVLDEILLGCD